MLRRDFMKRTVAGAAAFGGVSMFEHVLPVEVQAKGAGGGMGIAEGLDLIDKGRERNYIPEIRAEILNNPRAVFLIETHVDAERDGKGFFLDAQQQLYDTGHDVVSRLFVRGTKRGGSTLIKPNFTDVPDSVLSPVVGINTSPDFIAGFMHGLNELGNTNVLVGERGASYENHMKMGTYEVFEKFNVPLVEAKYPKFKDYDKKELNWHKVPGTPVIWNRIPTIRPIGDEDNVFINMPKLKCHNLGLTTLSIKNLQGSVPTGYGHYCNSWSDLESLVKRTYQVDWDYFEKDYYQTVEAGFLKHRAAGFKYWDYEDSYAKYVAKGGWEAFKKVKDDSKARKEFMSDLPRLMWDEQWCQRALDSASAITPDINIIEGVIGRDGSGFDTGRDELSNVIVAGLSMTEVDSVGSYIMGHDPRKVYYTRIASERGLGKCDIDRIDIYWIRDNGEIEPLKDLSEIKRTPFGVNIHTWKETNKRLFWD